MFSIAPILLQDCTWKVRCSIPPDYVRGRFPLPLRHGLTIGELAKLENGELHLNADLRVVEITGWNREDSFDATGLKWLNPSPNIRNPRQALLYPGLAMLEYSINYSVGRGTDMPFEEIGADWIRPANSPPTSVPVAFPVFAAIRCPSRPPRRISLERPWMGRI